jgi:hypothetical protein
MKRQGWLFTQEGTIWANGHWQSSGGSGDREWLPASGCLYKVEKGGVAYYPAPSYCVLENGAMKLDISYNRNYRASGVQGIEISEEQTFEYVPYFPKDSDLYYTGQGANISWVADGQLNVIQNDSGETIVSYNNGENLNSKNANLLKLTYASVILKKAGTAAITRLEWDAIKQALYSQYGNARIDGIPSFTYSAAPAYYPAHMTGEFSAVVTSLPHEINFTYDLVSNIGFYTYSQTMQVFKYPAMTMQPQYSTQAIWIGQQKVSGLISPAITPYISLGGGATGMHGFAYDAQGTITNLYDASANARFAPVQILRRVEGITCPITG